MSKPVVNFGGTKQEFFWEEEKIYGLLSRLHEHNDGRITAEINFKTAAPDFPPHIFQTQLNLLSARSKRELIKELEDRFPLGEEKWLKMIEQICVLGLQNYRQGRPPVEIWPYQQEIPAAAFLVSPLIFKDKPTIFFGEGSTGKSYLALTLGIICQLPFYDNSLYLSPEHANTLYLDYESDELEFRRRLTLLERGFEVPETPMLYRECTLPFVEDIEHLENLIAEYKVKFIVIDSLGVAAGNASLNDAPTATSFYSALRRLNVTTLIITHTSKEVETRKPTPFGSVYFSNLARSIFEVKRQQEENANEIAIALIHRKNNQGPLLPPQGFKIKFERDITKISRIEPETVPEFLEKMSLKTRINQLLKEEGETTIKDLAESLQKPEGTVRATLNRYKSSFIRVGEEWSLKSEIQ